MSLWPYGFYELLKKKGLCRERRREIGASEARIEYELPDDIAKDLEFFKSLYLFAPQILETLLNEPNRELREKAIKTVKLLADKKLLTLGYPMNIKVLLALPDYHHWLIRGKATCMSILYWSTEPRWLCLDAQSGGEIVKLLEKKFKKELTIIEDSSSAHYLTNSDNIRFILEALGDIQIHVLRDILKRSKNFEEAVAHILSYCLGSD